MTPPSSSSKNNNGDRSRNDSGNTATTIPKPVTREWDLHKINQDAIHEQLFGKSSKRQI
jgi:predicted kinase